jgi:hypothetical protein
MQEDSIRVDAGHRVEDVHRGPDVTAAATPNLAGRQSWLPHTPPIPVASEQ